MLLSLFAAAAAAAAASSSSSSSSSSSTHRYQAWVVKKLYSNACSTKFFSIQAESFSLRKKKG